MFFYLFIIIFLYLPFMSHVVWCESPELSKNMHLCAADFISMAKM